MKNPLITSHKYNPTLISIFNVPLSVILITAVLSRLLDSSVFIDFLIALAVSFGLFFLSFVSFLNIPISAVFSFIWTDLVFELTNNISPLKELYSSDWKYLILGGIFIFFDYIHLINHYRYDKIEQQQLLNSLCENNYSLKEQISELQAQSHNVNVHLAFFEQMKAFGQNKHTPNNAIETKKTAKNPYVSQYSDYKKGTFSKPCPIYHSKGEGILDEALHEVIIKKYQLGKKFGLRVLLHQPLSNYVMTLDQENEKDPDKLEINKKTNNKNHWMHFDYIIETRKGHCPLLAIELDGPRHNEAGQKKRDEYKNGVCDALKLPLIRIPYVVDESVTSDFIEKYYEEEIICKLISSLQQKAGKDKGEIRRKYSENSPEAELIRKFL